METNISDLLEAAKTNRKALIRLKIAATELGQYALASKLKDIQDECFPETPENREAKVDAIRIQCALRMVNINSNQKSSWIILETLNAFREKEGKFDLDHAQEIMYKAESIYFEE